MVANLLHKDQPVEYIYLHQHFLIQGSFSLLLKEVLFHFIIFVIGVSVFVMSLFLCLSFHLFRGF